MRALILTIVGGTLILNVGCGTAIKRTFTEIKGAGAKAQEVPGTSTAALRQYGGVKVNAPHSDVSRLVDPGFASALPGAVREKLTQRDENQKDKPPIFSGGPPILELDPEITFYSRPGSLGEILGSDSYAVVLFWLKADGTDVGKIQVVAKSGASRTGPDDLARASADGLAKFFKKHRNPGEDSDKDQED